MERTLEAASGYLPSGATEEDHAAVEQLRVRSTVVRQTALRLLQTLDQSPRTTPVAQAGAALSADQVAKLIQILVALKVMYSTV